MNCKILIKFQIQFKYRLKKEKNRKAFCIIRPGIACVFGDSGGSEQVWKRIKALCTYNSSCGSAVDQEALNPMDINA